MATPRPRLYPFQHCTVKKMYQEWLGQYYYRKASFLSVGGGKVKIKEASRLFCGNNFTFECVSIFAGSTENITGQIIRFGYMGGGYIGGVGILKILKKKLNILLPQTRLMATD